MGDADGGGGGDCVKVAIRCRPPSTKELNNNETSIVEISEAFLSDAEAGQVILNDPAGKEEPAKFAFDIVFGLSVRQTDVYESVGRPALLKTFEGYNGTIFAYGQTGSGKSFSMSGIGTGDLRGITPRVNEELFQKIAEMQAGSSKRFLVMCSYFEIYNEIIFDLLNPVADRGKLGGGLQIKEHPVMGIYVKDLTEIVAENAEKLEEMLESGQKNRAVSSTMMNATSSRSHSIFSIKVHQKDEEDASRNVFAKLNLVDLAGSERQKGTGATGQTLKEGANINKSLSALGNVINALVECANGKKVFIPYRNSKLTRVLQESLGGNSLCTMLAALSPAACNYEETMSTLRYANRAKAIKVSATKNEEASQISRLKAEVEELKKKLANAGGGGAGGGLTDAEREEERGKFERQLKEMEAMMSNSWGEKAKLSEEYERKMQRLTEDRRRAAERLEEERSKRFRLLQEKNDLELSIRGFVDFCQYMPKFNPPLAVLGGEQPRQWLKTQRVLKQHLDELREQRTMVLVFKHAFDEDVRLCGEGLAADDMSLAALGLNRCMPKLNKLKKGCEKLHKLESEGLGTAADLAEAIRQAIAEQTGAKQRLESEAADGAENAAQASQANALEEAGRVLHLIQKQVQEKTEELGQLASFEIRQTSDIVLQFAQGCLPEPGLEDEACGALRTLVADPRIAALPPCMPAKPLRDYDPSEVSDTPETTEAMLGQIIRWEGLCGGRTRKPALELLARPPPKFILDVTFQVKNATGFPEGIDGDWPDAREERLDRFRRVAEAIGGLLGVDVSFFDPADVLKGKEVPTTLRLMQLLAVAAARFAPPLPPDAEGVARARELPSLLTAMSRCLQGAKEHVEARRRDTSVVNGAAVAGAPGAAADSDELGLEAKIALVEQQLQKEADERGVQEEALADLERELAETQANAKKLAQEYELKTEASQDPELLELDRQLQELQQQGGATAEMTTEAVLEMLNAQLQEVRRQLEQGENDILEYRTKQSGLEQIVADAAALGKGLEAEVQRERQRQEMEQELAGQSPDEQLFILQAHEQKSRTRVQQLEEQLQAVQGEAEERKALNLSLAQETKELEAKAEDAHLQMQIVQEERDAMREAMEQLWNEKAVYDDELHNMTQAYVNLSERLNAQQDETCELQDRVEHVRSQVALLQKNGFHMA